MTAARTSKAAQPIPASIPMPDSPLRMKWWYQAYVRLARPTLDWVTVAGVLYALVIGPAIRAIIEQEGKE